eukprot:m.334814 g.334814  ORF g.334814 m.334814 type:complete len:627 (+) comp17446_c0_seq1:133-2013(+)
MANVMRVGVPLTLCLLAYLATAKAQGCGPGTVFDEETNLCIVATARERRQATSPSISTEDDNLIFDVRAKQKVGVRVDGGDVQMVDTSESCTQAVVEGIKVGYTMNREIASMKEISDLKVDMIDRVNNLSKESAEARNTLNSQLTDTLNNFKQETNGTMSNLINDVNEQMGDAKKDLNDELQRNLEAFRKQSEKTNASVAEAKKDIEELQSAVPTVSCQNGKKDGDETEVDCGGSCKPCAIGKSCKYSSDCDKSMCISGKCNLCTKVSGVITVAPGVVAFCKAGITAPTNNQAYLEFNSCGRTGHHPPTEEECRYMQSMDQTKYSLQKDMQFKNGYQIFTAPVDGTYTWELWGAQGGIDVNCCQDWSNNPPSRWGKGGYGGYVKASHTVKAGTVFYIRVGQRGEDCWPNPDASDPITKGKYMCTPGTFTLSKNPTFDKWGYNACGGFNGGGPALCLHNPGGASGGGGTDIRMCGQGVGCETYPDLSKRFLVAGGGGGAACEGNDGHGCGGYAYYGGHGGGLSGEHGYDNGYRGYGGTQNAGGQHECNTCTDHGSSWGALGQGGTGGRNDAGGGGGGYYGGGGAHHNSGGGGGSSFIKGTTASGTMKVATNSRGVRWGDGLVRLTIN